MCSCFARTPNEPTRPLPPHSKRLSFTPSSFAPRSHVDAIEIWNLLSLYWVQLKFCSFERLNATNQLHIFQNICYGDSDSLCVSISVKFYCFFLCISSLIVETKIYKYLRFGLTLIDTCSADITYFVILWKILSMYSILHMCCRNIVVNIQQLLRNSLRFSPCTNLSCTYIKKLISFGDAILYLNILRKLFIWLRFRSFYRKKRNINYLHQNFICIKV